MPQIRFRIVLCLLTLQVWGCGGSDSDPGPSSTGGTGAGSALGDATSCGTTCEDCLTCPATVDACASYDEACRAEPDCSAFRTCAGESDNPATIESCRTDHPSGAAAFCAYWGCVTYSQCDVVCEDAVICPRP